MIWPKARPRGVSVGVLDEPDVRGYADHVLDSIAEAEASAEVVMSPIAREITALLMVSPAFEGPEVSGSSLAQDPDRAALTDVFRNGLPELVREARDRYSIHDRHRARGVLTAADLFHYIADRGRAIVSQFGPYPKD